MISLMIDDAVGSSFACLCLRPAGRSWLADLTALNSEALSLFGKMGGGAGSCLKSGKMAVGGVKSQKFDLKSQSAKTKSLTKERFSRFDIGDVSQSEKGDEIAQISSPEASRFPKEDEHC